MTKNSAPPPGGAGYDDPRRANGCFRRDHPVVRLEVFPHRQDLRHPEIRHTGKKGTRDFGPDTALVAAPDLYQAIFSRPGTPTLKTGCTGGRCGVLDPRAGLRFSKDHHLVAAIHLSNPKRLPVDPQQAGFRYRRRSVDPWSARVANTPPRRSPWRAHPQQSYSAERHAARPNRPRCANTRQP